MNNRNWLISGAIGLFATFAFCQSSYASLIGDSVDMSYNLDLQTLQVKPGVVVVAGNADRQVFVTTNQLDMLGVDVEASSILIDFVLEVGFTAGSSFNGVIVSDLDFGVPPERIIGVNVTSSFGFDPSRVTFGDDFVEVNFLGLNILNGSTIGIDLQTAVVPIPAAIWLFGSGLIGLIGIARRKKA